MLSPVIIQDTRNVQCTTILLTSGALYRFSDLLSIVKALSVAVYHFECCQNLFIKLTEFEQHGYIFTVQNFFINDSIWFMEQASREKHPSLLLKINAYKYIVIFVTKCVQSTKLTITIIPFNSQESTKLYW